MKLAPYLTTVNDLIDVRSQINTPYLINASSTMLSCIRCPSLMNGPCLTDAPYENYFKIH